MPDNNTSAYDYGESWFSVAGDVDDFIFYGAEVAFGMLFPNSQMFVFPIPFPVKAKYFVMGYAALEIFLGLEMG